jgi:LacI family transcriptional regulator
MNPRILLVFFMRFEESALMLDGIARYARLHKSWDLFLDDQARAESDPKWLGQNKWHGVISRHASPEFIRRCRKLRIPMVDLNDTAPVPGIPKIRPGNRAIGHLGGEHFLERGHRHFGFCGFRNEGWACERRDGFVEAVELAGHNAVVLDVAYPGKLTPAWDAAQTRLITEWLLSLPKPAGVMACNDLRALQITHAAKAAGLLVPEEVAVLGANNDRRRCELAYPPLSSVATNAMQSGYQAAETLALMLAGEKIENMDARIDPVGVITRQSSDILAIEDRQVAAAINHIRQHACRGLAVSEVLRHAAASRSQLEKRFRRVIGRSPQAEIRRTQVSKIKELLFETDYPLKVIADMTAFEHIAYMSVVFKRFTGMSPGAYRDHMRSKATPAK